MLANFHFKATMNDFIDSLRTERFHVKTEHDVDEVGTDVSALFGLQIRVFLSAFSSDFRFRFLCPMISG